MAGPSGAGKLTRSDSGLIAARLVAGNSGPAPRPKRGVSRVAGHDLAVGASGALLEFVGSSLRDDGCPWSITMIRSLSASASSRYWWSATSRCPPP
jgi:hypothetical protein